MFTSPFVSFDLVRQSLFLLGGSLAIASALALLLRGWWLQLLVAISARVGGDPKVVAELGDFDAQTIDPLWDPRTSLPVRRKLWRAARQRRILMILFTTALLIGVAMFMTSLMMRPS